MGSDRLGHALIIPLCDTIQQVMIAFKAKSVGLSKDAKPVSATDQEALEGHQSLRLLECLASNGLPYTFAF